MTSPREGPGSGLRERLAAAVEHGMPRARADLEDLVAFRSVANPDIEPADECHHAAALVASLLVEEGFDDVDQLPAPDGSVAVVARSCISATPSRPAERATTKVNGTPQTLALPIGNEGSDCCSDAALARSTASAAVASGARTASPKISSSIRQLRSSGSGTLKHRESWKVHC